MDREPYILNSNTRAKSADQAAPHSAVDDALAMAREQDLQSPLEKRMNSIREIVDLIDKQMIQLDEKLGPILRDKSAIRNATAKPPTPEEAEAPLIVQLDALEERLQRIEHELHMIRCRACC